MNAAESSRIHSARRCLQRYGFVLSHDAVDKMVASIRAGQAKKLRKLTNTRSLFAVEIAHHRTILPVIYSSARKTIVTVLPEHVLDPYRELLAGKKSRQAVEKSADAVVEPVKELAPAPAPKIPPVPLVLPGSPLIVTFVSQLGPLLILTVRKKKQPRIFIGYSVEDGIRRLNHVEVRGTVRTDWPTAVPMLKRKMARLVADEPDCSQKVKDAWCDRTVAEIRAAIEAQQVIVENAGKAANQSIGAATIAAAA